MWVELALVDKGNSGSSSSINHLEGLILETSDSVNNSISSIKELLNDAQTQHLTEHLAQERHHFVNNLHHENGGIGIQAFINKETPRYK